MRTWCIPCIYNPQILVIGGLRAYPPCLRLRAYTVWSEILAGNLYFGGLAVLRVIRQYFNPPNFLQYAVFMTSSICRPQLLKMSARKLQTMKEWNENSPDLVYHQLVSASFDVLWFETDSAVFTLLPFRSVTYVTILL